MDLVPGQIFHKGLAELCNQLLGGGFFNQNDHSLVRNPLLRGIFCPNLQFPYDKSGFTEQNSHFGQKIPPQDLTVEISQSLMGNLPWYRIHFLGGGPISLESLLLCPEETIWNRMGPPGEGTG